MTSPSPASATSPFMGGARSGLPWTRSDYTSGGFYGNQRRFLSCGFLSCRRVRTEEMSDAEEDVPEEEEQDNEDAEPGEEEEGEEGEEDGKEEEHENEPPRRVALSEEMLQEGLSLLCKTGSGLAHAYVKLEVREKELTDISVLQSFTHLRYVDLSQNALRDLSALGSLTYLLSLRVEQNQLVSVGELGELPYLQIASLASNRLQNLQGLGHPRLESLNLIGNEVRTLDTLECGKLYSLRTLELRANQLQSTAGLYLPSLRQLYLAQNHIKTLEGLENLVSLSSLHLRDNQLESLAGFSEKMRALQYLNLRGNLVSTLGEVQRLKALPVLRALVLRENPVEEEDGYRLETLVLLPSLERLDKDFFEEEERAEAAQTRKSRLEEAFPTLRHTMGQQASGDEEERSSPT